MLSSNLQLWLHASGVNFTSPLTQSTNAPAHGISHSVSPIELHPTLQVDIRQKNCLNLLSQNLVINKYWQNLPLGSISSTCLHAAFIPADPKSAKSCLSWLSFFALLGSLGAKSAYKILAKFTPGWQGKPEKKKVRVDKFKHNEYENGNVNESHNECCKVEYMRLERWHSRSRFMWSFRARPMW